MEIEWRIPAKRVIGHFLYMFLIPIPPINCLFLESFRVLICVFECFQVIDQIEIFKEIHITRAVLKKSRVFSEIEQQLSQTAVIFRERLRSVFRAEESAV